MASSISGGVSNASSAGFSKADPAYAAGTVAAAFNDQPWTPRSFFDPPRVHAPDLVVFGTGKTYDFFA
ncbi:MAG: hypothetical protein GC202_09480 [Alphaproteobacteria bacterium]|nr:hypothetical protein [Alphaproteobacteria bacterium]